MRSKGYSDVSAHGMFLGRFDRICGGKRNQFRGFSGLLTHRHRLLLWEDGGDLWGHRGQEASVQEGIGGLMLIPYVARSILECQHIGIFCSFAEGIANIGFWEKGHDSSQS